MGRNGLAIAVACGVFVLGMAVVGVVAMMRDDSETATASESTDDLPTPGSIGGFEIRELLGVLSLDPAGSVAPGPDSLLSGEIVSLEEVDCSLEPRPSEPTDIIHVCGGNLRWTEGPRVVGPDAVVSTSVDERSDGSWDVLVVLPENVLATLDEKTSIENDEGLHVHGMSLILDGALLPSIGINEPPTENPVRIDGDYTQSEAETIAAAIASVP